MKTKKKILLVAVTSASTIATCAFVISQTYKVESLSAQGTTTTHKIELAANDVVSKTLDGVYYFEIGKENATYYGKEFYAEEECNYVYAPTMSVKENGHIFTIDGNSDYYVYFGMTFQFKNLYSFENLTLHGKFYRNEYKETYDTEIVYTDSDLSGNYLIIMEMDNLFKAELDLIEINYTCAI